MDGMIHVNVFKDRDPCLNNSITLITIKLNVLKLLYDISKQHRIAIEGEFWDIYIMKASRNLKILQSYAIMYYPANA